MEPVAEQDAHRLKRSLSKQELSRFKETERKSSSGSSEVNQMFAETKEPEVRIKAGYKTKNLG